MYICIARMRVKLRQGTVNETLIKQANMSFQILSKLFQSSVV